jgi:O-antigen ligase
MWQANPILGVGSGNFINTAPYYVDQVGPLTRADLIVDVPHVAHNTYLELLDELGVPGLLAFLMIVIASIAAAIQAARIYERSGDTSFELLSRCVALAILAQLSGAFFITNYYEKLLWLLLALPFPLLALARTETVPQRTS